MNIQDGYYWVRNLDTDEMDIGYWDNRFKAWRFAVKDLAYPNDFYTICSEKLEYNEHNLSIS